MKPDRLPNVTPNLARSLDVLDESFDLENLPIRVLGPDGKFVEGALVSVAPTELLMVSRETGKLVQWPAADVRAIEVAVFRRGRSWVLAILAIPIVTAALVAFAQFPWVRPDRGDIVTGFGVFSVIVIGLFSVPSVRRIVGSWIGQWQRVYDAGMRQ